MTRAVRKQLGGGPLVASVDVGEQAGVNAADPRAGISKGVQRSDISPLRKQSAVARRHVLNEPRHLCGQLELGSDFGVALLQLREMLLQLVVPKQGVVVVGRVIHDPASQLCGSSTNSQGNNEQSNQNLFLHRTPILSSLHKSEGIL